MSGKCECVVWNGYGVGVKLCLKPSINVVCRRGVELV